LLLAQGQDAVDRAARLERARPLEELGLEPDVAGGIGPENRRAEDASGDPFARRLDVDHAGSVSRVSLGTPSRTVKTVSSPPRLSTATLPPIACVSSLTIASPRPVPTGRSRPYRSWR